MKVKKLWLCLAFIIFVPLFLSGCYIDPWKQEIWYLESMSIDGKTTKIGVSDDYWFGKIFYDSVTFKFKEDKSFEMQTLEDDIKTGSYKLKKTLGDARLILDFDDGTKGEGYVGHYFFDGAWNSGQITIGETTYSICDEQWVGYSKGEWALAIEEEQEAIKNFQDHGLPYWKGPTILGYPSHFYSGTILEENEKFMFESTDGQKVELNIDYKLYFYQLESDGSFTKSAVKNSNDVILKTGVPLSQTFKSDDILNYGLFYFA